MLDMNMTVDQTIAKIPHGYTISAYILLIEKRICECCGSEHIAPGMHMRVQLVNARTGATRTISLPDLHTYYSQLPKYIRGEFENPVLPRRTETIETSIAFCQHCFTTVTDDEPDLLHPGLQLLTAMDIARMSALAEEMAHISDQQPTKAELEKAWHEQAEKRHRESKTKKRPVKGLSIGDFL